MKTINFSISYPNDKEGEIFNKIMPNIDERLSSNNISIDGNNKAKLSKYFEIIMRDLFLSAKKNDSSCQAAELMNNSRRNAETYISELMIE